MNKRGEWHLNRLLHGAFVFATVFSALVAPRLTAQAAAPPPPGTTDAKPPAFDVISIKLNKTGSSTISVDWATDTLSP